MNKIIKFLLLTLGTVIVLAGLAAALIFVLVDPNRFKPSIESVFAQQTGLKLELAGDIDWTFRPEFGLSIADARLSKEGARMELASLRELIIKIEPRELLDGHLAMQQFTANGLHINWLVGEDGISNWQLEPSADESPSRAVAAVPTEQETQISVDVQQISISDASLSIQDIPRGISAQLSKLSITSSNTNLQNRAFPFEIQFAIADQNKGTNAQVQIASSASIDMESGNARFEELSIKLNPLQLSGRLEVSNFKEALRYSGALQSNTFMLSDFLDRYIKAPEQSNLAIPGSIDTSSDQFAIELSFSGDTEQVSLLHLKASLDDMQLNANAYYRIALDGNANELRYNISANALDLSRYMNNAAPAQQTPADTSASTATTAATDIELPIDFIRGNNVRATHKIESLTIGEMSVSDIDIDLSIANSRLNLVIAPMGFNSGQISSNINLDATQFPPRITNISSMRNVDLVQLARSAPLSSFAQGQLSMESIYTMSGRTMRQLLDSINGTTSFSIHNSRIDVGIVKQVFSAISVLSPTGTGDLAQQWPEEVNFSNLAGHLILEQGIQQGQQLKVNLDNFEITALGGIDLDAQEFEYDVLLTLFGEPATQTIPVAPLYQGVGWPVICQASFDAEPGQYCGPDFGKVRELFVQISSNAVQRRAQEAITEQIPEELQDSARGLLDRIFRR
ncbi:MAG: AsmA family protein [Pseudohongiellaceae bacterium]|nr:AsmA family protein [Pseudohongiellaceae bacterium]